MKFSAFFCDDIRHEVDNKRSFVGVYSSSSVISQFPHIFPKICLFVEIELRYGDDFSKAEVVIFDEDHELARLPISDANPIEAGQGRLLGFEVTMSPIVVTKPEFMRAKIEIGGESHALRRLRFIAKDSGEAVSDDVNFEPAEPARKTAKKMPASRKRAT